MANPTLLSRLLCQDADKNTIPDTDAGTAGVFSQQYGWPAINSLPLSAGGKAVQRQDFNGVFNLLGGIAFYAQKGWQFEFDETQNYFAGCIVRDTVDGKLYECLNDVSASSTHPNADSTNWKATAIDASTFANIDLSNLTATGQNAFATKTLSNLDTANLSVHVVVESYYDSSTGNWYRVYDDGWVEQGGNLTTVGAGVIVNLLKPFANTKYTVVKNVGIDNSSGVRNDYGSCTARTTTTFIVYTYTGVTDSCWYACGMGANS